MAAEVHRLAAKGCRAVTFSENPAHLGLPSLHSDHWDPFWAACEDEQTVVCLHIGSSSQLVVTAEDAPMDVLITLSPINLVQAAADLIWSPVFRKFPSFKIAMSEGGIGWIPYFLDRIDYVYEHHQAWTGQDFGDQLPSQVFQRARHHVLHRRPGRREDAPRHRHRHDHVGVRLPALRLHVADVARAADEEPRRRARRRHRQDDAPQRDARLPLRPVRTPAARSSAPSARCGPRPPTSTPGMHTVRKRYSEKGVPPLGLARHQVQRHPLTTALIHPLALAESA